MSAGHDTRQLSAAIRAPGGEWRGAKRFAADVLSQFTMLLESFRRARQAARLFEHYEGHLGGDSQNELRKALLKVMCNDA